MCEQLGIWIFVLLQTVRSSEPLRLLTSEKEKDPFDDEDDAI